MNSFLTTFFFGTFLQINRQISSPSQMQMATHQPNCIHTFIDAPWVQCNTITAWQPVDRMLHMFLPAIKYTHVQSDILLQTMYVVAHVLT